MREDRNPQGNYCHRHECNVEANCSQCIKEGYGTKFIQTADTRQPTPVQAPEASDASTAYLINEGKVVGKIINIGDSSDADGIVFDEDAAYEKMSDFVGAKCEPTEGLKYAGIEMDKWQFERDARQLRELQKRIEELTPRFNGEKIIGAEICDIAEANAKIAELEKLLAEVNQCKTGDFVFYHPTKDASEFDIVDEVKSLQAKIAQLEAELADDGDWYEMKAKIMQLEAKLAKCVEQRNEYGRQLTHDKDFQRYADDKELEAIK